MTRRHLIAASLAALLLSACDHSSPPEDSGPGSIGSRSGWIGAWATAPYGPYPIGPLSGEVAGSAIGLPIPSYFPNDHAVDQSFRMIVHPTIGGASVRIRLSNLMGDQPVTFSPVRIGKSLLLTGPALVPGSDAPVTFDGDPGITVLPGDEAISDPVSFTYDVGDDLAISFHVVGETGAITWHAISFGPNYVGLPGSGDTTGDVTGLSFIQPSFGWFFISGIDVLRPESPGTIIAIGDSITDGAYTFLNTRWTDHFAHRLQSAGIPMGVLNEGINSNTVTVAATPPGQAFKGPPAVLRFDRDVLQRPGARSVVIVEGTNDLGAGASADDVFAGIRTLVERAHAAGLCVVVATIMPRASTPIAAWSAANEAERFKLNALLRAQTDIEGLADFDAATASPLDASAPFAPYFFPDLLHPNSLGTFVMAQAVPIEALVPPPTGRCVAPTG